MDIFEILQRSNLITFDLRLKGRRWACQIVTKKCDKNCDTKCDTKCDKTFVTI